MQNATPLSALMQSITSTLLSMLRKARNIIAAAPFWLMAFVAFLLRLFVVRPLGALLALSMGVVWCWGNMPRVRKFTRNISGRFAAWSGGYEQKSLWYDNVGRNQIAALIERLSAQGIGYCDLAGTISLPPVSHWHAISRELNRLDIRTQISGGAFYIAWKLPDTGAGQAV